jgi:hypothetical protein
MVVTALLWMGWLVFTETEVATTTTAATTIATGDDRTYQEHGLQSFKTRVRVICGFSKSM